MVSMIDNKSLIGAAILGAGAGLILHFILCGGRHRHDDKSKDHHKSYFARFGGGFGGGFHPHFYGGFGGWRGGGGGSPFWGARRFGNPYLLPYLLPYLAGSMYAPPPPMPSYPSFNSLFPQVSGVGGGFPM